MTASKNRKACLFEAEKNIIDFSVNIQYVDRNGILGLIPPDKSCLGYGSS